MPTKELESEDHAESIGRLHQMIPPKNGAPHKPGPVPNSPSAKSVQAATDRRRWSVADEQNEAERVGQVDATEFRGGREREVGVAGGALELGVSVTLRRHRERMFGPRRDQTSSGSSAIRAYEADADGVAAASRVAASRLRLWVWRCRLARSRGLMAAGVWCGCGAGGLCGSDQFGGVSLTCMFYRETQIGEVGVAAFIGRRRTSPVNQARGYGQ